MQRSRIKQSEHGDWCTTMPNWHLGSLVGSLANLLVPGQVIAGPQHTLHRVARLVLPIKAGLAHARPGSETVAEVLGPRERIMPVSHCKIAKSHSDT